MFKLAFKKFKTKSISPNLAEVINVDTIEDKKDERLESDNNVERLDISNARTIQTFPGIKPLCDWRAYKLKNHPGIIIIRDPFTERGRRYWIARCLRDYPRTPNIVNLNERLFDDSIRSDWWKQLGQCNDSKEFQRIKTAMRWTTFGYHHNWDTKIYEDQMQSPFPEDLTSMCQLFAFALGYDDFKPEAAIVNYYPVGTTLSGHTDHSEPNKSAPLFSFSFGQTAIFLIGGRTLDEEPSAIFLRCGDVMIMSEESRLCYHAVPRIIKTEKSWSSLLTNEGFDNADIALNLLDLDLLKKVGDPQFWQPFSNYIDDSRININVRQVLNKGDIKLD
ncbi:nucleic acid dioxygenase ALKBH1 isoform X2 [Drosophila ficusphila]|uniref:nucleic acid dioxygenase ALKBH1 isoform X2 n=1 Tax=Drosophila ficusphila TaxID=30025 RepID=UPI0007E6FFD2|nr:nucleic acid dioxygenase ALKBH1 isoform X2 [Drosophila ficusphila]